MTSGEEKKNQEKEVPVPMISEYGTDSLMAHWKKSRDDHHTVAAAGSYSVAGGEAVLSKLDESRNPSLLLQAAIVVFGGSTSEGQLIQDIRIPWLEIINELGRDPEFLFKFDWRKVEELVAGAYRKDGFEVILTPRSGDRGRDVMATKPGIGSIRIIDQVKAFAPNRRVTANDVRALLGVLDAEQNVSKGIITTTSQFAPGIYKDERLKASMPYRLELKDGKALREWLIGLA